MKWIIKDEVDQSALESLSKELGVGKVIAKLLLERGIKSAEQAKSFFEPSLQDLHDPFLMKDMDKAVERVEMALRDGEKIMVFGDYDVDGTTSVAMMYSFLRLQLHMDKSDVIAYVPDRYSEGYGVSIQGIDKAAKSGCSLIIALDCGIKANDKVLYAKQKGIDFIICDHHTPGEVLPDAYAVLDPKRSDDSYPFDELSGCGVGFKLIQAISVKHDIPFKQLEQYLDLLVVSIGADIVPIVGENRILAYHGLLRLNSNPRVAFALVREFFANKVFDIGDVVFKIAPRINAAGRMQHGLKAISFMLEPNRSRAQLLLKEINEFNSDRKEADSSIAAEALLQIVENSEEERYSTVVYGPNWHKGVIGIVASRLIETYYRPTVVFTKSNGKLTGSVRSVKGFDVYLALEKCSQYISQYGGHKYAAGLTIEIENFELFKSKFEQVVKESITEESRVEQLQINSELDLSDISSDFYNRIKMFAPFGPGNMRPVFFSKNLIDSGKGRTVGEGKNHLKLEIVQEGKSHKFDSIAFGLGHLHSQISSSMFNAAYVIEENVWNSKISIQLSIRDIKF